MFKHSCYIENSKEAREWLEMVGYEDSEYLMPIGEPVWSCLLTTKHGTFYSVPHNTVKTHIDCRGNLPLFKALTALRDDSDYMQEFVCIKSHKQDTETFGSCPGHNYVIVGKGTFFLNKLLDKMTSSLYKKATKEELIEHFKKEK